MSITKTLGGDRLGSGKKQRVTMHGYERSNHDLGFIFRSTMAPGTLVPFWVEVGLPGDTFDVNLNAIVKTHPTIGPLFASYKVQLDVFQCPIRLYQGQLHNNKRKIGLNMANIKLPIMRLTAWPYPDPPVADEDLDNTQIGSSCILKYLGISGIGRIIEEVDPVPANRDFNAVPFIAYWDIYKQYYCNQQENIGAVIHTEAAPVPTNITSVDIDGNTIPEVAAGTPANISTDTDSSFSVVITGGTFQPNDIMLITDIGILSLRQLVIGDFYEAPANTWNGSFDYNRYGFITIHEWRVRRRTEMPVIPPRVQTFPLDNIDTMREEILERATIGATPFIINGVGSGAMIPPYSYILFKDEIAYLDNLLNTQEGLALKTYQSDLFNNWLDEETIDGTGGIADVTSIDTSGGSFTIDTLNLANKVNRMLNRIAVSGGTYYDWIEVTYDHQTFTRSETPIYHGGLSKELVFQEITSNAETTTQPLGTLAGKGVMADKHKGGYVRIRVDEPSIMMGIVSITPRIDYSQGNAWWVHLMDMNDFHKPELDEIGFQDLQIEQMAWWDTYFDTGTNEWIMRSAGKQPAWTNYMTNVNKTFGNFAVRNNEMFMTLNRRYEFDPASPVNGGVSDLTTYIDPAKYNHIFAQTSLDAQNFWTQISVDVEARRKMSAKLMPNL